MRVKGRDMAEEHPMAVLPDPQPPQVDDLSEQMMTALKENKRKTMKSLMDNGLSLEAFLTKERLVHLYDDPPRHKEVIREFLTKAKKDPAWQPDDQRPLRHVGRVLQQLMGDYYQSHHLEDSFEQFDAVQEVFLWAVLMNRFRIAKQLWETISEPMVAALVASQILHAQTQIEASTGREFDSILNYKKECSEGYTSRAVDLLNECFHKDKKAARQMVTREYSKWGESSCGLIALRSRNRKFISQPACRDVLNRVWKGSMAKDTSLWKILLCVFLFPLICCCLRFKTHDESPLLKICHFYRSPVVIFLVNAILYLAFLVVYSYMLLVRVSPDPDLTEVVIEGLVAFWALTIFVAELTQWVRDHAHSDSSVWKKVPDGTAFVLFVVGAVLRGVVSHCPAWYHWGRVFLALALLVYFFRLLQLFCIHPKLGPKIFMIRGMIEDLVWFMLILLVVVVSYAIASWAILYPNTALSWQLFYDLPRKAYWHIYGELFLEEIEEQCRYDPALHTNYTGNMNDTDTNSTSHVNYTNVNYAKYADYSQPRCPSPHGRWLVPILLGMYMLITNVLLLNLLIAMFSSTYRAVEEDAKHHGHFLMFQLSMEYSTRPALPPPLIVISWILNLRRCNEQDPEYTLVRTIEEDEEESLRTLELRKAGDLVKYRYDLEGGDVKDMLKKVRETQNEMKATLEELSNRLKNAGI